MTVLLVVLGRRRGGGGHIVRRRRPPPMIPAQKFLILWFFSIRLIFSESDLGTCELLVPIFSLKLYYMSP